MSPQAKLTLLGLLLMTASVVAAKWRSTQTAFVDCKGLLMLSTSPDDFGLGMDRTCTIGVDELNCWTVTYVKETSTVSIGQITLSEVTRHSHGVIDCNIILP